MASPAPSRPTPREPDRRRCRRPPTTPQPQVAHPPGEPPDSSFLSPSRWFAPIRCHRAIIQLPDLGLYLSFRGCGTCGVVVNALALSTNPQAGPLRYSLAFHLRRSKKPNSEPKLRPPAVSKSLTRSTGFVRTGWRRM